MKQYETRSLKIDGFEVVEFVSEHQSASIVVDIGNTLYHWVKNGHSIIYFPFSLEYYSSSEKLAGNPLMYPWANRLESDFIHFNEKSYPLEDKHLYRDGNHLAMHGLLLKSGRWITKELDSDENSAWHIAEYHFNHTSEVFESFPFEHRLEMTHLLDDEGMKITLKILNESDEAIPVSFGFHPYFQFESDEREQLKVQIPYQHHVLTDKYLLPTGELEPSENLLGHYGFELKRFLLDDGFVHRIKGFYPSFTTEKYHVEVEMGDGYQCCVVYAPYSESKPYICIEPMVVPTNSLHRKLKDLEVPLVLPQSSLDFSFKIKVSEV